MSEVPNEYSSSSQVNYQNEQQQYQTGQTSTGTLMFFLDVSGQYYMHPYYQGFFGEFLNMLSFLYETINQKWTEEQIAAYHQFLTDLGDYINKCIVPGHYPYYQQYVAYLEYLKTSNATGFALYEKQLEYAKKKSQGHDFYADKKKNKDPTRLKQEPVVKKQVVEEKEKVVVRQGDPQINLEALMKAQWDPNRYLSTSFLAKQNANIVFIGHVDAGKSTLTGNILKELKQVDEQQILRNRQDAVQNKMEAWEQAGISDIIPEERQDGKTREFAKLNFSLEKKRFTLFDAPGHKNYVPNMIMGACQADIAVLIISAKEGQFESGFEKDGQTKEHAMLAKALGVHELIVVVTKMGTVDWKEKRFQLIKQQVAPFLQNSCGFHNVVFIPVESIQSANIHTRLNDSWYKGPSFLEYLDNVTLPQRKPLNPLRIPVIDKFKDVGNLYVYGKVESGTLLQDQTVTLLPERLQMVIREIFNAKDERLPFACAGENVKMRVKNIDESDITRGDMICNNLNYCQQSSEFKAIVNILELPDEKKLLSSGYECVIHLHAISAQVEISKVQAKIDKKTGKKTEATFLKAGERGVCVLKMERAVCLQKYDFMPSLGRFTLRDEGKTIGYGEVIGIKPAKTLLKQQKDQLLGQKKVEEELANLKVLESNQ